MLLHELLCVLFCDLLVDAEVVGVKRLRTIDLLRLNGLIAVHSDRHVVLLLHLTRSDLTLQLVEVSSVRHLDAFARRNYLIIKVVVIVIGHLVLEE